MGIFKGLQFAEESGSCPIIVESDAQVVVSFINSDFPIHDEMGLVIWDIKDFLKKVSGNVVVYASREGNAVAHNLMKFGLSIVQDHFWMDSYPPSGEASSERPSSLGSFSMCMFCVSLVQKKDHQLFIWDNL
ncbi:hypothetical protein Dsin_029187 [Dipteronia sinensis]|uniref:RNase H type-1 domain-containing protein n=1 Tax=Dipteronia sinensis TaxID=43782 RepID=A0AAE0DV89_9ROSI|nr:hypothetical protein Dsin_029187 [Dipteronia sinensis]